jgi:hypothetical protein
VKGIKTLGLAVFTALALTAFSGVASAAPGYFVAGSYPASINGYSYPSEIGGSHLFTKAGETGCYNTNNFTGTVSKPTDTLNGAATYFCSGSIYANLVMNGCEFILHPPSEGINGTIDIGGSKCSGITGYQIASTLLIPAQTGLAATFENEGTGTSAKVRVKLETASLKYEITEGANKGSYSNGNYTAFWKVSGENAGKATGVSVHAAPGLSIKSGEIQSELYPVTIGGEQTSGLIKGVEYPKVELRTGAGVIKCKVATFSSANPFEKATSHTELSPTLGSCTVAGVAATLTSEAGCKYDFQAAGKLGICGMEAVVGACKITVSSQLFAVETANHGAGANGYIEFKPDVSGVSYQVAGSGCPTEKAPGSYSDGKYTGVIKLGVIKVG